MTAERPMLASDDLEAEMQRLLFRLDDGFAKIAQAAAMGEETARWEDVWLELLREYDELCKERPMLASGGGR